MEYRIYLAARKVVRVHLLSLERLSAIMSRRWVANVAILVLTFLVTTTNIYASSGDPNTETAGSKSLLELLTQEFEDDLLVEEVAEEFELVPEVGYLDGQALTALDQQPGVEVEDDDADTADEVDSVALHLNAVAVQPEPVSAEVRPPTRTTVDEYEVVEGDNVEAIALKFGLKTATVLQANGLNSRSTIRVGQKLRIPPADGLIYKIKKGDSLAKIAKTYKSDIVQIAEYNPLIDASELAVGSEIFLPGGRLPAAPAPATSNYAAGFKNQYVAPDPNRVAKGNLLWPSASRRITQYYKRGHTGLDIGGPMRTELFAAESGTVIYSGWNRGGYGNMVIIDHGGGLYTRYAHATKLLTKAGDTVKRGDTIALMGSTGRSTGPHLHFEIMLGSLSRRANPLDYIQ